MKVIIGTVKRDQGEFLANFLNLKEEAEVQSGDSLELSDVSITEPAKVKQGMKIKYFTWEGTHIQEEHCNFLVENSKEDELMLEREPFVSADLIALGHAGGYRIVRDRRSGVDRPGKFEFYSPNKFRIWSIDAVAESPEHPVGGDFDPRPFTLSNGTTIYVGADIQDPDALALGLNRRVEVELNGKFDRPDLIDEFASLATEAGLKAYVNWPIEETAHLLWLMVLGARYDEAGAIRDFNDTQWAGVDSLRDMLLQTYLDLRRDTELPWDVADLLVDVMECRVSSDPNEWRVAETQSSGAFMYVVQDLKRLRVLDKKGALTLQGLAIYNLLKQELHNN